LIAPQANGKSVRRAALGLRALSVSRRVSFMSMARGKRVDGALYPATIESVELERYRGLFVLAQRQ